ncbi:MAG TPA: TPM domain-containing protein [Pyrinomonadaceae bacterium]|nr:TPM domain-containing protein [Pyrinomonadaceae bacterium]
MKQIFYQPFRLLLLMSCCAALWCLVTVTQFAQTNTQMPARTSHVNDFSGVVDAETRQQLEIILANVKLKTGIEFDIAVVDSTGGEEIATYSARLAQDWGIGSHNSPKKSLLLVLAVGEKTSFTRFSRSVQRQLPEGVLGEMGQRMRGPVEAGRFSEGLDAGVKHFVSAIANKLGLNADDFLKTSNADATASAAPAVVSESPTPEKTTPTAAAEVPVDIAPALVTPAASETPAANRTRRRTTTRTENSSAKTNSGVDDEAEAEEVELTLTLTLEKRVAELKSFLDKHPESKSRGRATELLVSAHAGLGDERLKKGDSAGGVEQLMLAIANAPVTPSERLFSGVISQIPLNLYLRGQRAAATNAATNIETKFGSEPKYLLAVAGFYLGTEQGSEAVRVAEQVIKIAPNNAAAHQALGLGLQISLRLEEALAAYKRALELDANSKGARRSLADLNRALGKSQEALDLYQQQLVVEPGDKGARAGLVLALFDLGRKDEAKVELDKAMANDPRNLALVAGVGYWYAAHNDMSSALTFGTKAIEIEPRYIWSYVAVSRALAAEQKPLEAERALRFAQNYGRFPTLDYELASTLASAALYDEAAETLMRSFSLKDDQIETRLAGHAPARGLTFLELLAPERRASVFQFAAADTETNAKTLKALLRLATLINQANGRGSVNEEAIASAAREFSSGDDNLRVYRQLYAASQLLRKGIAMQTVYELAQSARSSAEAGLGISTATIAVQAEEYRELRARAIASGGTPNVAEAPRNVLSNLLRGRIEDISGWALYQLDKLPEASEHLSRAANILPEGTPAWRIALWHLGAALDGMDKKEEALGHYIRSYNAGDPDPIRRGVIEQLYKKINGSLNGLDERIGPASGAPPVGDSTSPAAQASPQPDAAVAGVPQPKIESAPATEKTSSPPVEPSTLTTPVSPQPEVTPPLPDPTPTPTPETAPASTPSVSPDSPVERVERARTTVLVSGRVKDAQGNPMGNVVVVLISPQGTVLASTTDDQGNYSFTVAASTSARSFRLIPSKDGYTFEPADKILPIIADDAKEMDFVGSSGTKPS